MSSYSYGSYDALGRALNGVQKVLAPSGMQSYSMSYAYDLAGHLTSEILPSNKTVVTEYDTAGRVSGMKNNATGAYYVTIQPPTNSSLMSAGPAPGNGRDHSTVARIPA
jgi:YD repeat-containing protein